MVPFRHVSVGAEIGLHGLGFEAAVPVHERIVFKAGYNWTTRNDLLKTDIIIDTKDLHEQWVVENSIRECTYTMEEEVNINSGMSLGMHNLKAMVNWYPFPLGRFYLSGGFYYSFNKKDPFIVLSGYTTEYDWAALKELRDRTHKYGQDLAHPRMDLNLIIDGEPYTVADRVSRGYLEADFITSQFKYYLGMGLGRCIPNNKVGLQVEIGAMIYTSSSLYCQDKEITSIREASIAFGDDTKEILEYVDRYPVYPQVTMRFSFLAK